MKIIVHNFIVNPLRAEFPNMLTIPAYLASCDLAQMKKSTRLLDKISPLESKSTSLFTDQKGLQGILLRRLRSLVG